MLLWLWFRLGFLNTGIRDCLDWIVLYCEGCLGHCRVVSTILDLHPGDAGSTTLNMVIKISVDIARCPLEGRNCPWSRTIGLDIPKLFFFFLVDLSAINFNSIWFDKKGMMVQQTTYPKRSIKEILDSTYKVLEEIAGSLLLLLFLSKISWMFIRSTLKTLRKHFEA